MFAKLPHSVMGIVIMLHVVNTLGKSYFLAGVLVMAFTVGAFFGSPWRGKAVDRKGLRRALIPSVTVEAVVWLAAPFLPFWVFVAAAFVGGLFLTPVFSLVRQALAVLVPAEEQHTAFALDAVTNELMFMFGPMLGVLMCQVLPTRVALGIVGASVVLGGLSFMWFNPPTTSVQWAERERAAGRLVEEAEPMIAGEGGVELAIALGGGSTGGVGAAVGEPSDESGRSGGVGDSVPGIEFGGPAQEQSKSRVMTGAVLAVLGSSMAASLILSGTDVSLVAQLRHWGEQGNIGWAMMFWAFGSGVGGLMYGALGRAWSPLWMVFALSVVTIPLGFAANLPMTYILVFVAGLLCAPAMSSINATLVTLVPEHRRGEVMGWNGSASTVGSSLGSPAIGAVIDGFTPGAGFLAAGGIGLVLSAAGLTVTRRRGRAGLRPQEDPGLPAITEFQRGQ